MRRVLVPAAPSARPEAFPAAPTALNRSAADVPMASASTQAMATATTEQPSDIVLRPKGLRHGRWEAPSWAFWTVGGLVVVLALAYALTRLGYFRKRPG